MAAQPGLCRNWSGSPKTGFLTTRRTYNWDCEAGLSGTTTRTFRFRCELLHRGTPVGASPSCHSEILETIQGFPEWPEGTAVRLHAIAMFLLLRP